MKEYLLIAGIMLSYVGFVQWQGNRIRELKADNVAVAAQLENTKLALEAESRAQGRILKIHVTAEGAKSDVQKIDPQCAAEGPFVDAWRTGIERVRDAGTGDADDTASGS